MPNSKSKAGRKPKLEWLLKTREGREVFNQFLVALQSRASMHVAALCVGVNPNTLSSWLSRGKKEEEGLYAEFYSESVAAIASATLSAEVEYNMENPRFYLTRGFGRVLLNDLYNTASETLQHTYNLDGTISQAGDDELSIRHSVPDQSNKLGSDAGDSDSLNEQLLLDALYELRQAGHDINEIIDQQLAQRRISAEGNSEPSPDPPA